MPKYINVVGDQGNGQRFYEWVKRVEGRSREHVRLRSVKELRLILKDLKVDSPIYTGASTGVPGPFATRARQPSHPAHGMTIGNNIGDSGWQIVYRKINQYAEQVALVNPMWQPYLKYVEKGEAPHQTHKPYFVRMAWERHLLRRLQR